MLLERWTTANNDRVSVMRFEHLDPGPMLARVLANVSEKDVVVRIAEDFDIHMKWGRVASPPPALGDPALQMGPIDHD